MFNKIKNWFPPTETLSDAEQKMRIQTLRSLAITLVIIMPLTLVSIFFGGHVPPATIILDVILFFTGVVALYLLKLGKVRLVAIGILVSGYILITSILFSLGTVRTPTGAAYILLVVEAGLLFDLPGILLSSVACSFAILAIILAGNMGLLPTPDFTSTLAQWMIYTLLFGFTGGLSYIARQRTAQALRLSRKEIEERKKIEQQLRKLSQAVEQSPVSIMITDLSGKIEYVNPRFCQTTGYSQQDVIGKPGLDLPLETIRSANSLGLWETIQTGEEWRGEHINLRKDGSQFIEAIEVTPIFDANGTITNYLAVTEDVSEAHALQENAIRQRDLAHALAGIASIQEALTLCLNYALESSKLDSGGIYVTNRQTQDLELAVHKGLSDKFIQDVRLVSTKDPRWSMVMNSQPTYIDFSTLHKTGTLLYEGLRAFCLVPVAVQGKVIACFNLASHSLDEIPASARTAVELIASQVGNALERMLAREDLQQSYDNLAESEARFRTLFEQTHDAVGMFGLDGRLLTANQRAADLTGYSVAELEKINIVDLLQEPEHLRHAIARLLKGDHLPFYERVLRKKGGTLFPAEVSLELALDKNGHPLHIQAVVRDITERYKVKEAVEKSERRFKAMLENSADGLNVLDETGQVIYSGPHNWRVNGFTLEETQGQSIMTLVHPDDRTKTLETLRQVTASPGHIEKGELRMVRKDGSIWWAGVTATNLLDLPDVQGVVLNWSDISARKQAEADLLAAHNDLEKRVQERTIELSSANSALQQAVRARDEFLSAMSHELRTPLTGILGLAQVLQLQTYGPLSPKQINALGNIENSGQHLLSLINNILEYSSLQSNRFTLHSGPCSLQEVCKSSLSLVAEQAGKKDQITGLNVEPEDAVIEADATLLKKAIFHLLDNASKFTPAGGEFGIEAVCLPEIRQTRITVWDTGIGIDEKDFPLIFQDFVQLDARLARQYNGMGLGLAMVKKMIELQGGTVELQSTFGQGSRFSISLPMLR